MANPLPVAAVVFPRASRPSVIFLVSGIIIGMKLAKNYSIDPELGALLLGVVGCILSFLLIKVFINQLRKNKEYTPKIIKIIN